MNSKLNAKDFMRMYEEKTKGGITNMKELFNPEDDKRVVEDVSEKTSESEPKSTTVKSMNFFSKGNSDSKNTNSNAQHESTLAKDFQHDSDSQREDLLEQELLEQEVNFSKTGIVSSAAEDLKLPDNVDVSKLEDEDGDSSIVQSQHQKDVQWLTLKRSVKRSVSVQNNVAHKHLQVLALAKTTKTLALAQIMLWALQKLAEVEVISKSSVNVRDS